MRVRNIHKKNSSLIDELNDFTLQNDFIFINADFTEIVKSDDKINIVVNFKETEKLCSKNKYIGKLYNRRKVIRNNLIVDEGDPFNKILFEKSIANIKAKNIFSNVNYEVISEKDQKKIINLTVEEKATGEIFAGAGTGTTGTSFTRNQRK